MGASYYFWSIFWICYVVIMFYLVRFLNKRLRNKEKLSEKEINALLKENFPIRYTAYFTAIILITFVGGYLGGQYIQNLVVNLFIGSSEDIIHISHSDFNGAISWFLYVIFFLMWGIVLGTSVLLPMMGLHNPCFGRFIKKGELKWSNLRRPSYKRDMHEGLQALVVLPLLVSPFLILSANAYTYVGTDGIHTNSFFSFKEKVYSWESIEKIEGSLLLDKKSNGERYLKGIIYTVVLPDGIVIDLWDSKYREELDKIDEQARLRNITMIRSYRTTSYFYLLEEEFPDAASRPAVIDRYLKAP